MENHVVQTDVKRVSEVGDDVLSGVYEAVSGNPMFQSVRASQSDSSNVSREEEVVSSDSEVTRLYTTLSVAKEEVWKRWNNKELREAVRKFLGDEVPEALKDGPSAVLLRYIATPNFEASFFLDLAKTANLKPLLGEFLGDKFCTWNQDKLHLAKLKFFHSKGDKGHPEIVKRVIVDMEKSDGETFDKIETLQGEKLVDFHHNMLRMMCPGVNTFDAYWFRSTSKDVVEYYEKIFSVFLCYGILFENFILKDNCREKIFVNTVVVPAYENVVKRFGYNPLIFPTLPIKDEVSNEWMWYPGQLERE